MLYMLHICCSLLRWLASSCSLQVQFSVHVGHRCAPNAIVSSMVHQEYPSSLGGGHGPDKFPTCLVAGSRSGQTSFDIVIGDCGVVAAASGATIGNVPSGGQRRGVHTAAAPSVRLTSSFLGTQQRQRCAQNLQKNKPYERR